MKLSGTASAATDALHGKELDTESSSTASPAPTEAATPSTTASGDVEDETVVTPDATTPDSSSPLSDDARTLRAIKRVIDTDPGWDTCVQRIQQILEDEEIKVLSDAEAKTLARIRKDGRNGFMVSAVDVDFLLELMRRLIP